jgi:hypothetical protein
VKPPEIYYLHPDRCFSGDSLIGVIGFGFVRMAFENKLVM